MTDNKKDRKDQQKQTESDADSEASLQEELKREMKEGDRVIGDMAQDRNLSGSSTWETLPESSEPEE
jgi:hypothetical protein